MKIKGKMKRVKKKVEKKKWENNFKGTEKN